MHRIVPLLPGLGLAALAAAIAWPVSALVPVVSPLLVAIVLGIVLGNAVPTLPARFRPGLDFAAKPLLRLGIVALGAQVVLGDILDLGWPVLVLAAVVVAVGIATSMLLARLTRVDGDLALLIGCGFGICGAAAVAGIESTMRAKKEDVAAAIGLVVLFGTAMIAVVPLTSSGLGLDEATAGMWAGASTHEVAQVVAIGGIIGPAALEVAVLVKLARVIMLAPTVAILELVMRRSEARVRTASAEAGDESAVPAPAGQRPPIVPLFVIGFLLMAGLRTVGLLPEMAVTGLGIVQTVCLSMAMFALGRGVQWRALRSLGGGPIALATMTTIVVALVALGGALLLT
ncbi:putative sulfate exporter family transporter [Brevibacterium casei]|uniref:YeiH family protein n=1 Tax=Brevibacterium casei TaxID=33889 RepID=UPI00186B958D|nr:putative sulfate exporter family transporter [Brevibacterium casei]MBE4693503.1 putative sulfate exporter family transporter [Brevibacterium casei]MBY3576626.1 putative sulfate exporter family transporter [Brevibacterium casei]